MVAIVSCITSTNDLSAAKTMPFVASVWIGSLIESAATYYPCICWHWIRKKRRILWGFYANNYDSFLNNKTTYIDWQRIRSLAAPSGKSYIEWAYFYHHDPVSMNSQRKSWLVQCPAHILDCSGYYIRSI